MLTSTFRSLLLGSALIAGTFMAAPFISQAAEATMSEKLLAPQPLPDIWVGDAKAPVTIIEYASMTCSHCAAFHTQVYPAIKEKYIDKGKVRFTLREYPLDSLAIAGFMLGRCAATEKRNAVLELLFAQQKSWAFGEKPLLSLEEVVKQAGISHDDIETCIRNKPLYDQVVQERDTASKNFDINSTPTFFINGEKFVGEISVEKLSEQIEKVGGK